jgi:hypothetical protein
MAYTDLNCMTHYLALALNYFQLHTFHSFVAVYQQHLHTWFIYTNYYNVPGSLYIFFIFCIYDWCWRASCLHKVSSPLNWSLFFGCFTVAIPAQCLSHRFLQICWISLRIFYLKYDIYYNWQNICYIACATICGARNYYPSGAYEFTFGYWSINVAHH